MGLLNDIESSATSSSVPIVDLLRQCKVLAARLKHKEFADWVSYELNGYNDVESIPEYRIIYLPSPVGDFSGPFGRAMKNAPIPVNSIPKEFRESLTKRSISQPIAEVEELANAEGNLIFPWSGDIIGYMQREPIYQNLVLVSARSNISPATLKGVVDTVRTRVLDYVLAIQAENPEADLAKPADPAPISPQILNQTFNTTIIGGQANVGGQGAQSISGNNTSTISNKELDPAVIKLLAELRTAASGLDDEEKNEALVAVDRAEAQIKKGTFNLERVKNYLDIAAGLTNLAPVAVKIYEHLQHFIK